MEGEKELETLCMYKTLIEPYRKAKKDERGNDKEKKKKKEEE
jgi:hypothetical protein